ncbi:ALK tyrosine kinase receptor isoform X1 [Microplitis demolitor]|uniref:ALK tyrosine kinase receptor isoform X1 n=1 Tax=Microplitis demolitor TaxID=69319 RepID=UPI00044001C9|nr:ALK tyrosine kinase receptor isoform X1 [Microplitis demolitor]XP_053596662.1 ALK tyrosine kinase receptor isoform X1 [Microplitis demolitor]
MISKESSIIKISITTRSPRYLRRREILKRDGCFLFKLLLTLYCIVGGDCEPRRGIKELQAALAEDRVPPPFLGHCDFEAPCGSWNYTGNFKIVSKNDATEYTAGHYLRLDGPDIGQIWSILIPHTGSQCFLKFATRQIKMKNEGIIRLIIMSNNITTSVASERPGNDDAKWNITELKLGAISQPYRVGLEIDVPNNASFSIDNIRLDDCFPESRPYNVHNKCTPDMFHCKNGSCINKTRICDLTPDCAEGEDEILECDKVPETARCNFENGWCGWANAPNKTLQWTLHQGSTPTERTGPSYDHTYRNVTGTYAFVNSSRNHGLGESATINSPIFNPTPPYHADPKSRYYNSCQVRFFFHQYGEFSGSLGLYLIQLKPHQNHSKRLWWSYGDRNDIWYNQVVTLPDIRYRYFLQFESSKSYAAKADVAIDDFSLSPECFGIGVPADVVGDFNYYSPVIESEHSIEQHFDFVNETVMRITTCGATGRYGPTTKQCAREYNKTESEVQVPAFLRVNTTQNDYNQGIQKWEVPSGGYYTLIAMGARGGRGSGEMGSTLGALVRGVIELEKGQILYFLVGQPGTDACTKSLGIMNNPCGVVSHSGGNESPFVGMQSAIREVKNIELTNGGGGGGGATYIFTVKSTGERQPLMIAAGGGGLGFGQFVDDGIQHGHGPFADNKNLLLELTPGERSGGGGGGWNSSSTHDLRLLSVGKSLMKGGVGGVGCHQKNKTHGDGGFGGGGGGCRTGGGGGGYIGGTTGIKSSTNGEGGFSYIASELIHSAYRSGYNPGPGQVIIVPAISGCGCDFRCVAVDRHLSETRCLCPPGWQLGNDSRSCVADELDLTNQTMKIILIIVCFILAVSFSALCFILYNRYQNKKALIRRRQVMFGNGTELTSLPVVSDTIMTEFNPNYEFAGNFYSIKDLPQIPRESISCVKPLGQGAFGEVFQGVYKYTRNEEAQIAVKTLPAVTTSQAAADFMMEALIMSKFDHPNIVKFIGISFDKNPRYIILELLAGGDLKNFLREERPKPDRPTNLTMRDLIICAHDVASGCKYMEDARFIHRDIAARNCLLTCKGPGRVVKIADFGMARDIYRSDYYRKGGKAMLPIKWMPPESFLDGIFSTKTDVWAFGVLLWEIMSFGYMPYTGCSNREVMSMVQSGGRLEKPAECPDPIYGIMAKCWHPRPEGRPSFTTIVERLGYCLQDPDVTNHPMPNYDILPDCDREITIMRPDPETECINVHSNLDGCGYMQPRTNFRPGAYKIGFVPGIVYASLRHNDDLEGEIIQETTLIQPKEREVNAENMRIRKMSEDKSPNIYNEEIIKQQFNDDKSLNEKSMRNEQELRREFEKPIENGESTTTDTISDSLVNACSVSPSDTGLSSPNTPKSSPNHTNISPNNSTNNLNGIVKKNALKATLSLDPATLYRGTIPYEKISFSQAPPRLSNADSLEMKKESLGHELPREEECSC